MTITADDNLLARFADIDVCAYGQLIVLRQLCRDGETRTITAPRETMELIAKAILSSGKEG